MKIIPALLTASETEFVQQFETVARYYHHFSVDILDGKYADNVTIQIPQLEALLTAGKLKIPEGSVIDFDLMVLDYEACLRELETIADTVTIGRAFIHSSVLKGKALPVSDKITIGISIDPEETIDDLDRIYNLKSIDSVQIMTIVPGFQGSPFMMNLYNKVIQMRRLGYKTKIFIDGGVNNKSIPDILQTGVTPDFACVGSFLTHAPNIQERVDYLTEVLGEGHMRG